MGWMLLTVAAALAGGLLLLWRKVPGGMLVGAIVAVVLVNLTTGQAYILPQSRVVAQVLTGAYIGCMVTREDLCLLPKLVRPFLVVMAAFLALNLAVGFGIWKLTDLDLLTSLFCAAPGGMTDTPLVAMDMGAQASIVAVMQFVRMIFGMACLPSLVLLADRALEGEDQASAPVPGEGSAPDAQGKRRHTSLRAFLPTFAVALVAGIVGRMSHIPAGTLSFALVAVVAMKLLYRTSPMPMWLRRVAQVVSGCCIGVSFGWAQLAQLRQLIVPAVIMMAGYLLVCIGVGWLIHRWLGTDLKEAMLYLSPAGATEMALIAADLGVESTNLVVLQICRLLTVVVVFPQIFALIVKLMG